LVRVVALTAQGKIYFSDSEPLSMPVSPPRGIVPMPIGSDLTQSFWVQEGTAIKGILDPAIPRPVRGGWVVANVTSPKLDANDLRSLANGWRTSADVAKDGSFILTNLPPGTLEIMAGCEGYVSKDASTRPMPGIRQAQIVAPDRGHAVMIPMEATGDVRVSVQTPDGKPLAGATVLFYPNQRFGWSTNIIGTRTDSVKMLRDRDNDPDSFAPFRPDVPQFEAKTDANGVAVMKGLPPGQQSLHVFADSFDMPIEKSRPASLPVELWVPRRSATITVKPDAEVLAQVKMEPKGSTSLSAAIQAVYHWPR